MNSGAAVMTCTAQPLAMRLLHTYVFQDMHDQSRGGQHLMFKNLYHASCMPVAVTSHVVCHYHVAGAAHQKKSFSSF